MEAKVVSFTWPVCQWAGEQPAKQDRYITLSVQPKYRNVPLPFPPSAWEILSWGGVAHVWIINHVSMRHVLSKLRALRICRNCPPELPFIAPSLIPTLIFSPSGSVRAQYSTEQCVLCLEYSAFKNWSFWHQIQESSPFWMTFKNTNVRETCSLVYSFVSLNR